ncbi:MAG: hypothetical protein C4522_19515 [Desulfobacteraceae bacterium]|nr:MAG: hypothetical protein C4522_19515 [Desulfobacteraceae bacterium]
MDEIGNHLKIKMKLAFLEQMYAIYDHYLEDKEFSCKRFCDSCCTRNVTITTLEGSYILRHLSSQDQGNLIGCLERDRFKARFSPEVTINRFADCCRNGGNPPEEEADPNWTPCSLLKGNECPIYRYRPFGCRCLVSTVHCRETGFAQIDPLLLTINTIFQQYIEHIDLHGATGNLIDVILHLKQEDGNEVFQRDKKLKNTNLVSNTILTYLMIPPEHREEVWPILDSIQRIRV